jgi:hypothetical protein
MAAEEREDVMAVEKWVIVREFGDGSDFKYELAYLFEAEEAEAQATWRRFTHASNTVHSLAILEGNRRGPDHEIVHEAARAALRYLDPGCSDNVRYAVKKVVPFVLGEEPPPANQLEQLWRTARDLA